MAVIDFQTKSAGEIASVADLISTLPDFATTGAYEDRAIMHLKVPDHGALKRAYESLLPEMWQRHAGRMSKRFGFEGYRVVNYEGIWELPGAGNRNTGGPERGGLKVIFFDDTSADRGFVWMRGSGTEPVFRVLADIEGGDSSKEAELLELQKQMITDAHTRAFVSS